MKSIIVIPTYNEQENLPVLVERIFSSGGGSASGGALQIPELSVLVVDDNSPDGTGEVAEELAKKFPLKVLHRSRKEGLGTAYVAGFHLALQAGADYIFEMDADLSHDPAVILKMLEMMISGPSVLSGRLPCDMAIGSRYIPGGRIENWNWARRFVSRFGNFYARWILNLPYRDLTGGFKAYRRVVLEKMDLEKLSSTGYNFQIETTYRAHQLGFKICEIPITFTERKTGQSKFSLGIILESFWRVIQLRFQK